MALIHASCYAAIVKRDAQQISPGSICLRFNDAAAQLLIDNQVLSRTYEQGFSGPPPFLTQLDVYSVP